MAEEKKSGFRLHALNPMVLLGIIMFLAFLASYIVPAGEYSRVLNPVLNKEVVDPATFHYIQQQPVSPFYLFQSLTLGLQNAAEIISFLFIIGGMFAIMDATGAINAGLSNVVEKMKGRELLMIPVVMVLFSLLSAFAGCFEEFLAFTPLVIGVSVAMGFDSLTAIAIVFCAAPVGYAGAMTNPFTVGVAQGICGLPMFSGMGLRAVLFVVMNIVTIPYVMWYANKVRKNPELSTVREEDLLYNSHLKLRPHQTLHFELGRAVVGQCGSLISQVLYVKQGTNKQFAILDAGMTDLIRPALYQAFHKIENITSDAPVQAYDVVGPICESSDVFGKAIDLNGVKRGDLIALRSAGAYGEIMASGYNCRELPQGYTSDELV